MRLTLASAAIAGIIAMTIPAYAQEQGWDFSNQCDPGFSNRAFCYGYVTGFFYSLESNGQLCPRGVPDNAQMVAVVEKYLHWHNAGPPKFNIRAALLDEWGCRRR
jgi:hypothetical protein